MPVRFKVVVLPNAITALKSIAVNLPQGAGSTCSSRVRFPGKTNAVLKTLAKPTVERFQSKTKEFARLPSAMQNCEFFSGTVMTLALRVRCEH